MANLEPIKHISFIILFGSRKQIRIYFFKTQNIILAWTISMQNIVLDVIAYAIVVLLHNGNVSTDATMSQACE